MGEGGQNEELVFNGNRVSFYGMERVQEVAVQ